MKIDLKEKAKQLETDLPALFLCMKDEKTPAGAKILGALTIAYALSPIDLIPDFIPVIGYLDDVIILPVMTAMTIRQIPPEVFDRYRAESKENWENGRPKKWYYAIPIVLIWVLILWQIAKKMIFSHL